MRLDRRRLAGGLAVFLAGCASGPPRSGGSANRVVSDASPALTLQVAASFRRLPSIAFPIENLTNARREIFVDAGRDHIVRRAVIVQFETVRAGSDFRFRYPSRPPQVFGAQTYRFGAFAEDDERAAAAEPAKEAARTRAHLIAHGYQPPRIWRAARLARVADPNGLSEVIVFYFENADPLYPPGPLAGADESGDADLDAVTSDLLLARLREAVTVISG